MTPWSPATCMLHNPPPYPSLPCLPGVGPYTSAVKALFDPAASKADLISIAVTDPHSITLRWRLEGKLQLGEPHDRGHMAWTTREVSHVRMHVLCTTCLEAACNTACGDAT
jgi:hypothetical protein